MTLEQLSAERETLTELLIAEQEAKDDEAFAKTLRNLTLNYTAALELVLNPTPKPVAFVAIFALGVMRHAILKNVPEAEKAADDLAELWDISATTVELPHLRQRKEDTD